MKWYQDPLQCWVYGILAGSIGTFIGIILAMAVAGLHVTS